MCVGLARTEDLVTASSRKAQAGSVMLLYGASTGRDGIGGVSVLASATLGESDGARPSVQIADPFSEKLLIEATLEMVQAGLLEGLQDLGGAGITCAVSESAARAGLGAELDLDNVPLREPGMAPLEILTSESQERMLAIVPPSELPAVQSICDKWGINSSVIATLVKGGTLTVRTGRGTVAEVTASSLADDGPVYDRAREAPTTIVTDDPTFSPFDGDLGGALLRVLSSPNVADKTWVSEQYDSRVQGQTVIGPGSADAAVVRVPGTLKGLALSTDGKGRFGSLDPYLGAAHAVAESARNVAVTGARPLAITNCLNFGNPERPDVMWQFAEAVRGIADACTAFETPVTGGNVSFYNESASSAIWPTPVIGMLGLLEDHRLKVPMGFTRAGLQIYLAGETYAELGGTEFAEVVLGSISGHPPALDLSREVALQRFLVAAARADLPSSSHDCSDGGIGVALAECAMVGGHGFAVDLAGDLPAHLMLFSESAARAVISVEAGRAGSLEDLAASHGVSLTRIGETGGPVAAFGGMLEMRLNELEDAYRGAIPNLMGA
jgi:phosphoribosylformylglycinamidine synthase II